MDGQDWTRDLAEISPDDERVEHHRLLEQGEMGAGTGMDLMAPPPPPAPQTQHIQQSQFEHYLFDRGREQEPRLDQAVKTGSEQWQQTEALSRDIFQALFTPAPVTQDVDPDYQPNATALDEAMQTTEWQKLAQYTQLDDLASAIGASAMTRQLVETILKQQQEEPPQAPTPPPPPGEGEGDGDPNQPSPQQQALQALYQQQLQQYQQQVGQQQRQQAAALRAAARNAAQQAQQEVEAVHAALDAFDGNGDEIGPGWGTERGTEGQRGDIAARAKLARMVASNPRLQLIAKLAGRMKFLANAAQKARVEHIPDEIAGVELGDDLPRVLPSEYLWLADPDTEDLFYMRAFQHALLQVETHGSEPQGKGPIIVCVDESASMANGPTEWAAAAALALLSIAAKQQRDFRWIHFATRHELTYEDYPKGRGTPEQVMASATHFYLGAGTSFDTPLAAAREAIETSMFAKADVIFITDGECRAHGQTLQEWHQAKAAKQFNCYGIMVGSSIHLPNLKPFCDAVAHILDPSTGNSDEEAQVLAPAFSV